MPSRSVHLVTAVPVGAGFAFSKASQASSNQVPLEALGGALGGYLGGLCPDFFDPPTSPNHRALGHGLAPAGLGGVAWLSNLDSAQGWLRRQAEQCRQRSVQAQSPSAAFWFQFLEFLCVLGAGVLAGFVAGYASHLALDFATPRSLPLIG
ncbi:MAG: hypothetical protein ACRD4Q_01655 [Candidatus Acidiferrales bacterium]